jgi:hypothetical protein
MKKSELDEAEREMARLELDNLERSLEAVWERVFLASLDSAATSSNGWAEDRTEFLINRAELLADAAVQRLRARRMHALRARGVKL